MMIEEILFFLLKTLLDWIVELVILQCKWYKKKIMRMMNSKLIERLRQNNEVKIDLKEWSRHSRRKVHVNSFSLSLFDTDPSSCKNELNRSYSRAADYRLPPLIETHRGRMITLGYMHLKLPVQCSTLLIDWFSFFFFFASFEWSREKKSGKISSSGKMILKCRSREREILFFWLHLYFDNDE